jgi:putative endopeptidase
MAPETLREARRKVATVTVGIGYPEHWRNYETLDIRADDAFGNAWRAQEFEYRHQLAKLGQPVDRGEWWLGAHTVNAVFLPLQNAMNFPAGILEPPFYDRTADAAYNYGAIGSVIGHEISHSFDDLGAEFDAEGRLRNWWTSADLAHFREASQALVRQYNGYEPFPGLHLNGELTLGENLADLAGLAAAYDAYHASLGGRPAPVIEGLTGDQRFFLGYANAHRESTREATLRNLIAADAHSPGRYRVEDSPQRGRLVSGVQCPARAGALSGAGSSGSGVVGQATDTPRASSRRKPGSMNTAQLQLDGHRKVTRTVFVDPGFRRGDQEG